MKASLLAIVAAILGVTLGVGVTVFEFASATEIFVAPSEEVDLSSLPGGKAKAVVVGDKTHDFGAMERNATKSHEFVVKNEGTAPLTLEVQHTTCKCTVALATKGTVPPGESTTIKLEWTPIGYTEDFRQSAEIRTNDPGENQLLHLVVHGRVIQAVRPLPEEVNLSNISVNEDHTFEVKVFGFAPEPLEIVSHEFLRSDTAEHFSVDIAPLSAEEIAAIPDANSGQRLTLTMKSGLPIGAVNQTIRLRTSVPAAQLIEIPIHLTVASDISLFKATAKYDFTPEKNLLKLGKLPAAEGAKVKMYVWVKGPHRETTQIQIAKIEPAGVLLATLGEPEQVKDRPVLRYPLEVVVPPGTASISRQGGEQGELGKITFSTTHPTAKEVRLFVQFAVE